MRTTVSLAPDVAAAVEEIRRSRALGLSDAINELIRAGLREPPERHPFHQRTFPSQLLLDVADVAEALEILEGPTHR